ncbi:MAG: hypothetical protein JNK82_27630 [Myxococcaceae bacterium]|nr:hypothetical protein [Myxococcaceae bacterium]
MDGVITTRDVLKNLPLIWREFGAVCALKCIKAVVKRERTTFLDVACGHEAPVRQSRTFRN